MEPEKMKPFQIIIINRPAASKHHVVASIIISAATVVLGGITFASKAATADERKLRLAQNDSKFLAIEEGRELREIEFLNEFKKLSAAARRGEAGGDGDAGTGKWKRIQNWFGSWY